ncbi:SDR family NAD(P)-dependent oxidoreductase [Scytonema sp. NUACC26]|uniref:SDR family NAD(P)-dependent oxidoreductase n=1 Tax=Scytonema sp. NUACC26 TaxID=3140176 RepID=UPI0034DBDE92
MDKSKDLVAIIGMACRFPGAKDYHQFWDNLEKGINNITEIPSNRWNLENFYSANPEESNKSISKWGGFIEGADKFDPMFFCISRREAMLLDPQQRLMLEMAWSCLEDGGYSPAQLSGTHVGVFVGVCNFDYKELLEKQQNNIEGHLSTGTYTTIIPNRISYFFNFHGPSVAVDTACSSSLVAIHQAINALKENECEMVLVGGVNVLCTPTYYISFSKLGMLSPQGQCKTFDAKADGYVRGEGAGVILLKPLKNAIKDKDYIYGVIRGSAVNHGGTARTLTSPNAYAQSQVIRSAYTKANISPNTVSYIEAHGTGTPLGDPIEINGLKRAFTQLYQQYGMDAAREPHCGLGSVKTNIGHLESAAGIAGIIKVLLAMKHKKLPKITNYQQLNPRIKLEGSPFYIVEQTKDWQQLKTKEEDIIPRRAGVSSFGFGGVNAHVILEEAPTPEYRSAGVEGPVQLLTLSAKSEAELKDLVHSYEVFLTSDCVASITDVCFTANKGRSHFDCRLAVVAESTTQLRDQLSAFATAKETFKLVTGQLSSTQPPKIAFLFTGQGSQYIGMGRSLYETQPTFRATINRCDEILRTYLDVPLLKVLYPEPGETSPINETAYTQPVLFTLEYALAELWQSWGIKPAAVMGHSVGEYVAATVAGVFSLEDGLMLIAARGRLMQALPQNGEMVALLASKRQVEAVIQPYLHSVSIAALNGSESVVISGKRETVRLVVATLEAMGIKATPLQVSHAFHSPLMEPMLSEFARMVSKVIYSPPKIDLIANVTGELAKAEVATGEYWCQHVCQPVQFAAGILALYRAGYEVFVECGPKPTLLGMGRKCLPEGVGRWLPSLSLGQEDWQQMLQSLAQLYVEGAQIDWSGFYRDNERLKVALPTYPFQGQRYWIETTHKPSIQNRATKIQNPPHPLLGHRLCSAHKDILFESYLNSNAPAFLKHHCVYQKTILPVAAYLEMAVTAGTTAFKSDNLVIEDVVISQALTLSEEKVQTVQLILTHESVSAFQIYSLVGDSESDEESWKLHIGGKFVLKEQKLKLERVNLSQLRERCNQELSVAAYYQQCQKRGIDYGTSFQAIERLFWQEGETLGRIRIPEALVSEALDYQLHPVLLDACFQVSMAAFPASVKSQTYLPFALERLEVYRRLELSMWSHAQMRPVKDLDPETLTTDLSLFDENGTIVLRVDGLSFKRTSPKELLETSDKSWQDWLYEVEWRPQARFGRHEPQDYLLTPFEISDRLTPKVAELIPQPELLTQLESLSVAYILYAFNRIGWKFQHKAILSTSFIAKQLGVVSQHQQLLSRLLEILVEVGVLRQVGEEWEVAVVPEIQDPQKQWSMLLERYPTAIAELTLLGRCGARLAEVLQGSCDPLQLLFPAGDATTAASLYQNSPAFAPMNVLVQKAISVLLERLPAQRGVRILEIGAGTGGTTSYILPHLSAHQTKYVYTDIGTLFATQAREKFRDYPFVEYRVLDIEKPPETQGFDLHQYDLILAANVLHATSDLRQTLQHVQQLLTPGGMLVLLEGTARRCWIDLIFGLLEGWWKFSDRDLRPDYPLLKADQWRKLLQENGFKQLTTIGSDLAHLLPQSVIVASAADTNIKLELPTFKSSGWLILADRGGIGQNLALRLQSKGEVCTLVFPGQEYKKLLEGFRIDPNNPADFERLLAAMGTETPLRGVVHLWSLDAVEHLLTGANLEMASKQGCGSTLHLVQALVKAGFSTPPSLWLVTQGAVLATDRNPNVLGVAQSSLWGMGKVIALEHPELNCIRVDLDPKEVGSQVQNLFEEIWSEGSEDQVAFRDGIRHVARLIRSCPIPTAPRVEDRLALPANQPFQLSLSNRGNLENLELQPTKRRQPSAGEIEIRAIATGLNFRDILNALDLYPGDPGSLGLECAGEVVAIGEGVEGFEIGDAVLAITPGSFKQYVTVDAALVAIKPEALSFEEAATIPVTFLTAHYTLHHLAKISPGDRVLIHAATGGVGQAAVQLAQQAGAEVFGTASPGKWEFLKSQGVKHVMNSRTLDFADEVMAITKSQGVDIVLNCLTGEFIPKSLSVVSVRGRFLEIGKRDVWEFNQVAEVRSDVSYFLVDLIQVCQQQPALIQFMLRQLMQQFREGQLKPIPQMVFPIQDAVSAFRYLQQAKHIGKIVVSQQSNVVKSTTFHETSLPQQQLTFREDNTYLITGGLGGLGLLVARWMVEKGARHLVLAGRSGANDLVRSQLKELEQAGAEVVVAQADVSDEKQVARLLAEIELSKRPLRGIVHAVGVLDDGILLQQNWERFERVMAPKIQGAWNLHTLTHNQPLDFFVLFSSVASLLGNPGQANHAAANAVLDALAYYRRAMGLPGLSINWGPWATIGAAAQRQVGEQLEVKGMGTIAPQQGLDVLEQLFSQPFVQVGVVPIDWSQFTKRLPISPFFYDFTEISEHLAVPLAEFRQQLEAAIAPQRRELLVAHVRSQVAKVLGINPSHINLQQGFFSLGMDSLTSVELRNCLQISLKSSLPPTLTFDYPTVEALVNYLTQEVLSVQFSQESTVRLQEADEKSALSTSLEELSSDEIAELLAQELGAM